MTEINQIYKCNVCGNIVEVVHASMGQLVCCGEPMQLMGEKTIDAGMEKHVPIMEQTNTGIKVRVGSIPHPMDQNHYIEMIELIADGAVYRKNLKPGEKPEAEFCVSAKKMAAREHCTVHGLWKSK